MTNFKELILMVIIREKSILKINSNVLNKRIIKNKNRSNIIIERTSLQRFSTFLKRNITYSFRSRRINNSFLCRVTSTREQSVRNFIASLFCLIWNLRLADAAWGVYITRVVASRRNSL